jgi:5-methylcytosine-specific restriction endonuclease McrA
MKSYSLSHLSDHALLRDLAVLVAQDRSTTAAMLAHLAEVDERRLYVPAGYPSMYAWCLGELRMSEDAAFKRIRAARAARRFPATFPALADGRLSLSAVVLLAPYLTSETAAELLALAAHRPKAELERLLAERFPQPDLPSLVQALSPAASGPGSAAQDLLAGSLALAAGDLLAKSPAQAPACETREQLAPGPGGFSAHKQDSQPVASPGPHTKLAPLAPGRFALQVTLGQETYDKLRYAQALLGHAVPSGDLAQVLDRALDALIPRLEQRKFATSARSCPSRRRGQSNPRYIPAAVRRAVWQRDGGQCTFVSEHGHRCEARRLLEFDHVDAVARGGQATADRMRLRCRPHNQYAAECVYGIEFMRGKREHARRRTPHAREVARSSSPPPAGFP